MDPIQYFSLLDNTELNLLYRIIKQCLNQTKDNKKNKKSIITEMGKSSDNGEHAENIFFILTYVNINSRTLLFVSIFRGDP